jgi:hypothetical protein
MTGKKSRGQGAGATSQLLPPEPRGDVPREPKRTYTTLSVRHPRVTNQFNVRQIVDKGYITCSNAGQVNAQLNFTFGDMDNVSSFGALFDQYRFDAVTLHIVPNSNATQVTTPATTAFQPLYVVIDYDDGIALPSQAVARQYTTCIELSPGESCKRTIQPRIETAMVLAGPVTSNVASVGGQWLDCAITTVPHRGFKILVPQAVAAQTILQQWNIYLEYWVSFRTVR